MATGRITVLVDNTVADPGLLAEHGWSVWVEVGSQCALFDTGAGRVLTGNAAKLGVELQTADAVVLSHGHLDHTGGLTSVLPPGRRTRVYSHPAAFQPKFSRRRDGVVRAIGLPSEDERAIRERAELVWVDRPTELCGGAILTGPIPRRADFEDTGGTFFKDELCVHPDLLEDDQALFIATVAGTVVVLGCAHSGVVNTLHYVRELTGGRPIHMVIGGMHLLNANEDRLTRTVAVLRELDVQRIGLAHCTGFAAMARLYHEFPDRCFHCVAGTRINLPGSG